MLVIHADIAAGKSTLGTDVAGHRRSSLGKPAMSVELRNLLAQALKLGDCARLVRVQKPLPLRFRRGATPAEKFQCIITLE